MITFYKADETDFDNNGLGVLDHDIQNPDIEEKLNDIFTFSFNYPIFAVNGARLAARMIVKADDPENEGQLFRIMKLSKSNGMLTAFCYHIFYDLNGNEIPDTNIVGQNGQTAITQMLSKTAVAHKFQGFSDISDIANIRVVRMSPVKFLIDPQTDNNFINRLGGEIRRVNYRIWMNKVRGSDNGATIRWKKSLDSYNATWDYTTIATRIRPVGYNGIMLPESYVDSPLIDKYETIVIKEIQYSDIKAIDPNATSNDETAVPLEQAYELLRQAAAKEFSENNLDKPTVTLSVNMVALRNMDEYKDVKSLETINPWDTVTVINERDGLSVKVRLNHYHWNPVTRKFISMELGNAKSAFTDIGSKVDHATNLANQANDTAKHASASADGKNTIYRDVKHEGIVNPVNGDTCFEKNGDKEEIWIYNGKSVPPSWELIVDDATGEEVRQNVDAAQKEAEEAKTQADDAVGKANQAVEDAGFANDTADQAKTDAAAAGQQAQDALTTAGTALTNAQNALNDVTKLDQTVKTEVTNINGQLSQKVSQITFDALKGTVTSQGTAITQNKDAIGLKADTSLVNTIKQTVTNNTAAIDLNSKEIKLKASQSDVDKLGGRVTNAEAQIKLQADQIKLTVSKTELNNTLSSYATQTWTQGKLDLTANGLTSQISSVKSDLTSLAIGGRNYILNSDQTITINGDTQHSISIYGNLTNEYWTFSAEVKYTRGTDTSVFLAIYSGDMATGYNTASVPIVNGKIAWAFKPNNPAGVQLLMYASSGSWETTTGKTLEVSHQKLEKGNKATDWSPAPEDMATVTQFTSIDQTLKGVQITANNAVTQTQLTATADTFMSTINSIGAQNLLKASGNGQSANNIYKMAVYTMANRMIEGQQYTITINGQMNHGGHWGIYLNGGNIELIQGPEITTNTTGNFYLTFTGKADPTGSTFDNILIYNMPNPENAPRWASVRWATLVKGPKGLMDFAVSSSEITQLQSDVNLRVQKGDVINQINISPESILIAGQKVHITGQTTIDNAVIKDAMIEDIKADKITAGTLDAANVNVINLNANSITTGTIKGAELSLNLNTGEVVFQHGRIHSASNNVDVNIDEGYLSTASSDTRVMLKEGQLQLVQPTIFDNSKDPYLEISNSIGGASFNGANIIARDYLVLANRANSDAFFDAPLDEPETFAGLAVGKTSAGRWKPTRIGGADRGIIMRGGTAYKIDSSFMYKNSPEILIGTDAAGLKPSDRIYINGSFVHITSAYWRTASGSANLMVAQDGALVRSTSASKYKTDIIRTNIPDYGDKLLNLPTATWTDIAETKRYRDDPANQMKPTRNFGMIAEDLADAGLEMLVVRGTDGELEGINYDRIGPALIPVIAKLKNKIEKLEQKLEEPV